MKNYFLIATTLLIQLVAFSSDKPLINSELFYPSNKILSQNSSELIVSFENLSPKQYQELDLAVSEINGIRKKGFCEKMNIFYFTYDSEIYRSNEEAFDALILKTKNYQPLLKIGATATDVQRECEKL